MPGCVTSSRRFAHGTLVFECLVPENCVADNNDTSSPLTAFRCAEGHAGVLCASCQDGYYNRKHRCWRCDEDFDVLGTPLVRALVATLGASLALLLAYKLFVRRHRRAILRVLSRMRNASRSVPCGT